MPRLYAPTRSLPPIPLLPMSLRYAPTHTRGTERAHGVVPDGLQRYAELETRRTRCQIRPPNGP
eukprot:769295-Rhodomonas_salina.1